MHTVSTGTTRFVYPKIREGYKNYITTKYNLVKLAIYNIYLTGMKETEYELTNKRDT